MKKYVTIPTVREACQLTPDTLDDICEWLEQYSVPYIYNNHELHIRTLEGLMLARMGDWVVKGVRDEFYPVKDEIFRATYRES